MRRAALPVGILDVVKPHRLRVLALTPATAKRGGGGGGGRGRARRVARSVGTLALCVSIVVAASAAKTALNAFSYSHEAFAAETKHTKTAAGSP